MLEATAHRRWLATWTLALALTWSQSALAENWWQAFGDPQLDALVNEALRGNPDLDAAAERIVQAEATALRSRAVVFPTLSANARGSVAPTDSLGFQFGGLGGDGPAPPSVYYTGSATLDANYRLSAWGRDYLAYKASRLQKLAQEGDRDALKHALTVQVVEAYLDAVLGRAHGKLLAAQLGSNEKLATLTERLFEQGDTSALAVLQQRQQVAAAKANLPNARTTYRTSLQRLLILTGQRTRTPPKVAQALPGLPPAPKADVQSLLSSRADLRAQQARVKAAGKQRTSAKLGHLPELNLNAQVGAQAFKLVDTSTQSFWNVGAAISLPLFSGFADVRRVDEAAAAERAQDAQLEQLLTQATGEVAQARIQEEEAAVALEAFEAQLAAAEAALAESERAYVAGTAGYLDLLNTLLAKQRAEVSVLQAQRSLLGARVQLHQALGDGGSR